MALSGTPSPAEPHAPRTRPLWLLFTDSEAVRTIDVHRLLYPVLAIGAFAVTEFGRHVYRPYVYEAGINDFGLADSIGNLGGIVVQIFASLAILNSRGHKAFNVIGFLAIGYILYEIVQPFLPRGVFDAKDIYGTIIGALLATGIVLVIRLVVTDNRTFIRF